MLVPEPSRSLYPSKVPELRAHVVVDGKPRLVFDMHESGNKVTGFISGAYDSEFEVRLWDGRTKKATRGFERTLYFGDHEVSGYYCKAGDVEYKAAPDARSRFHVWSEVRVDDEHTRPFKFGPVPTTDSRDGASRDAKFLDGVSAIKIEYRKIHNVKIKVDRKSKKHVFQASTSKVADPLAKQKKDKRAVHEQQEKGQFGVAASFGELKKVKKYVDNGKKTTTTYEYVNKDEPDVVFVFYIRSDPWIRSRLADEEPEEVERSVTPPVEVGDTLYIGLTQDEVEEEEKRAAKRPRVDKAPQDKGKRAARPLSRSPSPTSTRGDSPHGSGDFGGEDPHTYGMSDDDSGSDGDSYLLAPRRASTSSGPAAKKASSVAPKPASTDLVAFLQAQLAASEAANARLRAQLEPRPNKRKELGDAAPPNKATQGKAAQVETAHVEAAHVETAGALEPLAPKMVGSTGSERTVHAPSHASPSTTTTRMSVETEPVVATASAAAAPTAPQLLKRTEPGGSSSSAPVALAPAAAPVVAAGPSPSTIRTDSASQSSAAQQPLVASELPTAAEQSLAPASIQPDGSHPPIPPAATASVKAKPEPIGAEAFSSAAAQSLEPAAVTGASSSALLALAPAADSSRSTFTVASHSTSQPSATPQQPLVTAERSQAHEPSFAPSSVPALGGDGAAFSLVPLDDAAQHRLRVKVEANEERLAVEAAEERLAAAEEKGDEPQDKVEVKPEETEERLEA